MDAQWPGASSIPQTASTVLGSRKRSDWIAFLVISLIMLGVAPLLVMLGLRVGAGLVIGIVGVIVVGALLVRWPIIGFFLVAICALAVDQGPLAILGNKPEIYVFYWPSSFQGLPDRPIGFFMLFIILALVIQGFLKRRKALQGGALFYPYMAFLLCVVWGIVHGLTSGGDFKIMVNEVRSFWYLFLGYILAYNLISSKKQLRLFFWIVICCAAIKAFIACYIYFFILHGVLGDNREIMAHEESYFWVGIILLIVLFNLHHRYRPQLYTALALLPFICVALVANNRRTDFLALMIGCFVAWILVFLIRQEARKKLLIGLAVVLVLGGGYVLAFGNGSGGLSSPARAVISMVHPDPEDASSNAYRDIEDYDLTYTVHQNPLGLGFGKPFLQPILLPNILSLDPVYLYIPHNTIYWVWMRLGPLGYLAMWCLFGSIIARGAIIARNLKDKYLQVVAIYIVCMVVMEILAAYSDYQLSFYRNVIFIGMLAGIVVKLPVLDAKEEKEQSLHEVAHTHAKLSIPDMGSRYT